MPEDPYASFSTPATPATQGDPYASVASPVHPSAAQNWQSQLKPIDLGNGKQSVQRPDGGVWFGPQQGNTGKSGWFDGKGNRMGDVDGQATTPPGFMGGVDSGLHTAGRAIAQSAGQFMGHVLEGAFPGGTENVPQGWVQSADQDFAQRQAQANAEVARGRFPAKAGSFIGQAIPAVAATVLTGGEAPAATFLGRAALAIPGAMATTYATTPGTEAQKTVAGLIAAPATVVGQGLGELGGKVIQKVGDVVNGKLPAAMQSLQDIADKYGIKLRAGDLDRSLQPIEDATSRIPLSGMNDFEATQQQQAQDASQQFVNGLKAKVEGGGTPSEVAMASGRSNHASDLAVGHSIYDAAGELAGTSEAPRNNVIGAMQEALADNARASKPDQGLADDLTTRIRRLTQTSTEAQKAGEVPMDRSFQGIKDLATEFWKESKRYDVGTPENALYSKLSGAARQDLTDFANNSGNEELKSVTNLANDWWKNKVKNYSPDSLDYGSWAKQLHGKDLEPEKVMDYFVQAGQDGKAKYFYNGLDDNGRAAVRWGIANDAFNKATGGSVAPGNAPFSPATFASEIERYQAANGVFFKGEDKWQLDGFTNLMRAVQRSGSANSTIKTGWGALTPMIGAGEASGIGTALVMGHPAAAAAAAAPSVVAATVLKPLFTTEAGKRLLLTAADLSPTSKMMQNILSNQLPKVIGVAAGRMGSPQPPQENTNDQRPPS